MLDNLNLGIPTELSPQHFIPSECLGGQRGGARDMRYKVKEKFSTGAKLTAGHMTPNLHMQCQLRRAHGGCLPLPLPTMPTQATDMLQRARPTWLHHQPMYSISILMTHSQVKCRPLFIPADFGLVLTQMSWYHNAIMMEFLEEF